MQGPCGAAAEAALDPYEARELKASREGLK